MPIKHEIKRFILDRSSRLKELVAEVSDRFVNLAKVRFKSLLSLMRLWV